MKNNPSRAATPASAKGKGARTPTEATRTASMHSANTITKDFLLLSQPFVHAGILIASASSGRCRAPHAPIDALAHARRHGWESIRAEPQGLRASELTPFGCGRRWYVHHLSEIPLSEVFLTRTGNHLQRIDKDTVKLAGSIALSVEPSAPLQVPSVHMTEQIPTTIFNGPTAARDQKVHPSPLSTPPPATAARARLSTAPAACTFLQPALLLQPAALRKRQPL